MNDPDVYKNYLLATNELLVECARWAKQQADLARASGTGDFESGYLSAFHRVITLMQQQTICYALEPSDIGLGDIREEELF